MDTFGVKLAYLFKSNGDVIVPNTTPNSLGDIKNNFKTGDLCEFSNPNFLGVGDTQLRKVVKGGKRIEPILYSQIAHTPVEFTGSINLIDKNTGVSLGGEDEIPNFQASIDIPNNSFGNVASLDVVPQVNQEIDFTTNLILGEDNNIVTSGGFKRLKISQDMINNGVSLTLKAKVSVTNKNDGYSLWTPNSDLPTIGVSSRIINKTTGQILATENVINGVPITNVTFSGIENINIEVGIAHSDLVLNDEYAVEVFAEEEGIFIKYSSLQITQNPTPGQFISTQGLFLSGSDFPWPHTLFSTSSLFLTAFEGENMV